MKKSLPEFLKPYFWDVDFEAMDGDNHPTFVISRVLDRGSTQAVRWVVNHYGRDMVKKTLLLVRGMDRTTGILWSRILNLDEKEVPCLRRPYSQIHWELYS